MNAAAPGPSTNGRALARQVRARLQFRSANGQTGLSAQFTPHPFHITRPFHHPGDAGGMATLYLQSSSGGLYGDDDLTLETTLEPGARVHLTTQASTVVHDARGLPGAVQRLRLHLGRGARLDYLPDPVILLSGAELDSRIEAILEPGAQLILSDAQLHHDPRGAARPFGQFVNDISITGPEGPLLIERQRVAGGDWTARTGGAPCAGMLIAAGCGAAAAAMMAADEEPGAWCGISQFTDRDVSVLRLLARDGVALTGALRRGWSALAASLDGHAPAPRRK